MDLGNFDRQAKRTSEQVVGEAKETIISAALALYSELQKPALDGGSAPVASGRYASSLRVSLNKIDTSVAPADPGYKYPPGKGPRALPPRTIKNDPISRIASLLRTFKLGDTIYISDAVPYVRRIEIGRHSWQAPDGVFGPAVRKILQKFRNVNIRVNRV